MTKPNPIPLYYKLDSNHEVVLCKSVLEWGEWMHQHSKDRIVKQDSVGPLWVSTVFLGLDHSIFADRLQLFETMIFDEFHDDYQTRCSTWDEALTMHETAMGVARALVEKAKDLVDGRRT